ncbi:growth-regulating factor 7-like [Punica granatum]|uniref:Growth-regulating factor n=1 Tax=Punica granatum TaxID=22663 RepID=A0A6P8EMV9_PUNGR|nr:growth-regulating factor 7-like [Punica granatum]
MEFGAVGLDGLVGGSDPEDKQKLYGSAFFRQLERPPSEDADEWRVINSSSSGSSNRGGSAKVAKFGDDYFSVSAPKAALKGSSNSLFSDAQQSQHMLCFSSSASSVSPLSKSESQPPALPCFSYTPSVYSNYAGLASGGLNGGNMHGMALGGGRGPFTPSQWMELEHQAMIYKYINANVPVPSNLLIPIRKAFESAGFSCYASGLLRPNSLGWGGFQLGFSNSTDPEPGRCRRTDGKKWRCSRDAVADQKYCERHMNRGRHRSRKPVEGLHSGHPVSGGPAATTATVCATTATPSAASANKQGLPVGSVVPGSGASHNSYTNFQSGVLSLSADSSLNRFFMNKENVSEKIQNPSSGFSMISPSTNVKSKATPFLIDSSSERTSSLLNSCQNLGTLKDLTDRETESDHSIRHFINDWPVMSVQSSDATHLSISIPMASNDNRVTLSPLRSAHDLDQVQMNLGVGGGTGYGEQVHKQTVNWIPISWETSMGGPLGEVLHNANNSNSSTDCKNSSVLNLMTEGWESSSSSPLGSSPTGVLQKTAFGSVSNSSAGSSPRVEENRSKPLEGSAMCSEV